MLDPRRRLEGVDPLQREMKMAANAHIAVAAGLDQGPLAQLAGAGMGFCCCE